MKQPSEVRERAEEIERASLSTWATLASESKGRDRYEEADAVRTTFQLDRDRLLQTDAFARLAGKSHAFVPAEPAPGWRSRLSQTLASVQLTRALARGLRLNEDLAEAIATGHELGAPPFGRAGQDALDGALGRGFSRGEQGLRVVETLEPGANLTWEVRDGILHQHGQAPASTLEGQVAALGQRLATALAELRASLRAGVIQLDDVPAMVPTRLGLDHGTRVATVIADAVAESTDRPEVRLGARAEEAVATLEAFAQSAVHRRGEAVEEHDRAVHLMRSLAVYGATTASLEARTDSAETELVDRLTGATDADVLARFTATFLPSSGGRR